MERIKSYFPTGRGDNGVEKWISQRDEMRQISQFENLAFREKRKIFLSTLQLLATLDEDLFRTRAADNQVKPLSNRKVDKEGHSGEARRNSLFGNFLVKKKDSLFVSNK